MGDKNRKKDDKRTIQNRSGEIDRDIDDSSLYENSEKGIYNQNLYESNEATIETHEISKHGVKEVSLSEKIMLRNTLSTKPLKKSNSIRSRFRDSTLYVPSKLNLKEDRDSVSKCKFPSVWHIYCRLVTLLAPDFLLKRVGFRDKSHRLAWREKMGLVVIIATMCTFVGYLTFGLQPTLCRNSYRIKHNQLESNYITIKGYAYDVSSFGHPASEQTGPDRASILGEPLQAGKSDLSLLFQDLGSSCNGIVRYLSDFNSADNPNKVPFPCVMIPFQAMDFSLNETSPRFCHTSKSSIASLKSLRSQPISYTWEDVKGNPNLIIFNGAVLDMNRVKWFSPGIQIPNEILNLTSQRKFNVDVSMYINTIGTRNLGKCISNLFTVGFVDTTSVGCIASNIIMYISLVVILGAILSKFFMATYFGWFMSRKLGVSKKESPEQRQKRLEAIEDWTNVNNHYGKEHIVSKYTVENQVAKRKGKTLLPKTSRYSTFMPGDEPGFGEKPSKKPSFLANSNRNSLYSMSLLNPSFSSYNSSQIHNDARGAPSINIVNEIQMCKYEKASQMNSRRSGIAGNSNGKYIDYSQAAEAAGLNHLKQFGYEPLYTFLLVTCYSEGSHGIRTTLDSLAGTDYPSKYKCLIVICDGLIKGEDETFTTPDICLSMMHEFTIPPDRVQAHSYVAVASGAKRHNKAKVYSGFYKPNENSPKNISLNKVPMVLVVKCGTESEVSEAKPGNRGKRDSQVILMSFLQRVTFDERMTELEYDMFNAVWSVTGVSPDHFEIILMVDADTKVYPDSLTNMVAVMAKDNNVMGLCGETKIANKTESFTSMIQVFEYYIAHHQSKAFESVFGGVTCLPGCFCMYRIKAPKGTHGYWAPILVDPNVVECYSENVVETLHRKNLLLLGEDRYLSTLMLKHFPKRKMLFIPAAVCKTIVPAKFKVLLSQRRRWINSTVHNLMELVFVRDLCGTFCFSMQFIIFMELVGTLVLPAAIMFTVYLVTISFFTKPIPWIPLILLAIILGLPAVLIGLTSRKLVYVGWMLVYLSSIFIWNFVLPVYAYWNFDDFSWGETRRIAGGEGANSHSSAGEFNSSSIIMKRWCEFEYEKRCLIADALRRKPELMQIVKSKAFEIRGSYNPVNGIGQISALVDYLLKNNRLELSRIFLEIEKRGYSPPFALTTVANKIHEMELKSYRTVGDFGSELS
ncbi:hypothetical protein BB560_003942 [Smittium megazygosporum]|uniref:chitin synthase n=1 Tax=Smittium megazygosporum TaxID=133381 RepID=A0A2T9ZAQ4_9FUNG|nr:hypothetical protein BB560_003942 [Smittium megazygosporum]